MPLIVASNYSNSRFTGLLDKGAINIKFYPPG